MSKVNLSADSTQGKNSFTNRSAGGEKLFIDMYRENINEVISEMYFDLNYSPIKNGTAFADILKQISAKKKINLNNVDIVYYYTHLN